MWRWRGGSDRELALKAVLPKARLRNRTVWRLEGDRALESGGVEFLEGARSATKAWCGGCWKDGPSWQTLTAADISDSIATMEAQLEQAIGEVARLAERYGYALGTGKYNQEQLRALVSRVHDARAYALALATQYAAKQHDAGIDLARSELLAKRA